jgi:hypothetical protein
VSKQSGSPAAAVVRAAALAAAMRAAALPALAAATPIGSSGFASWQGLADSVNDVIGCHLTHQMRGQNALDIVVIVFTLNP